MAARGKAIEQATERGASLVDSAYAALKHAIRESVFAPGYQASAGSAPICPLPGLRCFPSQMFRS